VRRSYFSDRNPNFSTIRLRVPLGIIYPEQLDTLKGVAQRYGRDRIHLTVRKTVEIPGISTSDVPAALEELARAGWYSSSFGNNLRNVVACPGLYSCPNALVDTAALGLELDSAFADCDDFPAKVKIAIAGCPNACSHPLINDIGVVGVSRVEIDHERCTGCGSCKQACREDAIELRADKAYINYDRCIDCGDCARECGEDSAINQKVGYRIYIGGKMGRHPRFAEPIADLLTQAQALRLIESLLLLLCAQGKPDERLANLVDRLTLEGIKKQLGL